MNRSTRNIVLLVVFAISAIGAALQYHTDRQNILLSANATRIEKEFQKLESEIISTISDEVVVSKLITDAYTFPEFSALADRPYGIIVYQNDSALIWTNNNITPVKAQMVYNDAPLFITESNGDYVVYEHDFPGEIHVIGFLPLQYAYDIKNKYLNDVKTSGIAIPPYLTLSARAEDGAEAVHSVNGNIIFYLLQNAQNEASITYSHTFYFCAFILFLCLLIFLFLIVQQLVHKRNVWFATGVYAVLQILLYVLVRSLYPLFFVNTPLFLPEYYGSPGIADSTGDLLVKVLILFPFAYFFSRYFHLPNAAKKTWLRVLLSAASVAAAVFTGVVFRSLIMDSSISFNIHNFFSLNYFSLIGFICISLLLFSFFLFVYTCLELCIQRLSGSWIIIAYMVLFSILVLGYEYIAGYALQTNILLFTILFVIVFALLKRRALHYRTPGGVLIWLIFFSAFSAIVFNSSIQKKDQENKKLFAIKKSIEKDPITEYLFQEMQGDVVHQLTRQGVADDNTLHVRTGVINQVRDAFQNNYFKKYNSDLFVFNGDSLLFSTLSENIPNRISLVTAIENDGERTSASDLYFINDYSGNYYYLAEMPVKMDSGFHVMAYLRLLPKKFSGESIYPELLIDDDLRIAESYTSFNYAIYSGHTLSEREGEYSYPLMDIFYLDKDRESENIMENNYDHYVYKVNDTKKVVVSEPQPSWFEPVSLFSYLFFFHLLFIAVVLMLEAANRIMRGNIAFRRWINTSLQNKIQTSVISLIVFAFIILGVATIYYISNQYNFSHKQRLLEKIESVQTNMDYMLNETRKKNTGGPVSQVQLRRLGMRVSELSDIHSMDINMYTPGGDLVASSQPDIFEKGLVSSKMNPLAFFKMSCDKETWYIQTEKIGDLPYLSAYVPVLDNEGETMFFLNLPYFATEKNLRAEISSFMVTLVNVYVLLLILAGFIAFFVSRSITSPLATIAGKFKNIRLGKTNEPIIWKHNDEIGLLVREYNKMLQELENSAELLARSSGKQPGAIWQSRWHTRSRIHLRPCV
ncbi:MAG: hypothetical protein R2794_02605 [Chitinophagales bacterium]